MIPSSKRSKKEVGEDDKHCDYCYNCGNLLELSVITLDVNNGDVAYDDLAGDSASTTVPIAGGRTCRVARSLTREQHVSSELGRSFLW
jgi:hypothetical protein